MLDAPAGWFKKQIRDVCRIVAGFAFPLHQQGKHGQYPFFKVSDMNARGNEVWLSHAENEVDYQTIQELKAKIYPRGTVVFPKVGAALLTNKRRILGRDGLFDNNVMGLIPDHIDGNFLFHLMHRLDFREIVQPGAVPSVNATMVGGIQILVPPLIEQRQIASILSSVDETIEKTQAVIDQLEAVKKGLLGKLLTRGVPGLHKELQQTESGHFPTAWRFVLLDSVAKRGSGHTPDKKHPEYWDGSIKWVSLKDSARLDRLYISDTAAKITPLGIDNSSAVKHPAGTVVLSRDAGVGKSAITTDTMAVSQHFIAWQCGPDLDNHFLYYWLQRMKPEFERIAIGNTIKTIGLPYFKQLKIPLPPIDEQRSIANSLKSIDLRIFAEEQVLDGLHGLKTGLLIGLLSGKIQTNQVKEEAA